MPVAVFGSINIDLAVRVTALPRAGETVFGAGFSVTLGGKGANQAVAAARMGAATRMTGRVGTDAFGALAAAKLSAYGVDVTGVIADASAPTGIALIHIDEQGGNSITVVSGANAGMTGGEIPAEISDVIPGESGAMVSTAPGIFFLLLQGEVPLAASIAAARAARRAGWQVMFDPAPPLPLDRLQPLLALCRAVTPNETETLAITGINPVTPEACAAAAAMLHQAGAETVILKRGAAGVYLSGPDGSADIPAPAVAAIDTVAAGDCFAGALAALLEEGMAMREAVRLAVIAATLSTTHAGAADSMPARQEVLAAAGGKP